MGFNLNSKNKGKIRKDFLNEQNSRQLEKIIETKDERKVFSYDERSLTTSENSLFNPISKQLINSHIIKSVSKEKLISDETEHNKKNEKIEENLIIDNYMESEVREYNDENEGASSYKKFNDYYEC